MISYLKKSGKNIIFANFSSIIIFLVNSYNVNGSNSYINVNVLFKHMCLSLTY